MPLPELHIGGLKAPIPIIQGGMGVGISGARLASAVSNAGGIGVIAAVALGITSPYFKKPSDYFEANVKALRDEIRKAFSLSRTGNIGVNCMVAITDYEAMVRTSLEEGVKLIISGAGLPLSLPEFARDYPDVALVPIVSSVKAAELIFRRWEKRYGRIPDAFVVEAPGAAGGHLGAGHGEVDDEEYTLEKVVPEMVRTFREKYGVDIPVIAAGGIWSGEDVRKALDLGASGVQMATRFVCTVECDAPDAFKQAYLDARPEDVVLVKSPVGLPGRGVRNPFSESLERGDEQEKGCFVNCLVKCSFREKGEGFCIARALVRAKEGDAKGGLIFAGKNVSRCSEILTVEELMKRIVEEAEGKPTRQAQ
ncbi:MAG: nitronate monooxygenase [Deltaproteobacteria bacterium]|nr:MAG: nitronate monooxygenase [Deltaproteobacteria bacterium]